MATVERTLFRFLGTLVTLAWAMHEMAHLHDLTRHDLARQPGDDPDRRGGPVPPDATDTPHA